MPACESPLLAGNNKALALTNTDKSNCDIHGQVLICPWMSARDRVRQRHRFLARRMR